MAQFFNQHPQHNPYGPPPHQQPAASNLQFYQSSYNDPGVSTTPAAYGFGGGAQSAGFGTGAAAFGAGVPGQGRGGLQSGWLAAFGTGGYEDEPPLLEELGINFGHIKGKTLIVLNPFTEVPPNIMQDSDLAGPFLFCLLFGTFLLLSGKVHFGYIYGVGLLGSISLHVIFNLMSPSVGGPNGSSVNPDGSPSSGGLNYIRTASVLGYCLLPLVITSSVGVVLRANMNGAVGYVLSFLAISWCTYSASNMFVAVLRVRDMRFLLAYPLALFYSVFGIMAIFGTAVGEKK